MSDSLSENYAAGGFGKSLQPGRRPALLVIDFVRAYLVPGSPLYAGVEAARDALPRTARGRTRGRTSPFSTPTCDTSPAAATAACSSARYRHSPASRPGHTRTSRRLPRGSSPSPARP